MRAETEFEKAIRFTSSGEKKNVENINKKIRLALFAKKNQLWLLFKKNYIDLILKLKTVRKITKHNGHSKPKEKNHITYILIKKT